MKSNTKHILHIFFNEFTRTKHRYGESVQTQGVIVFSRDFKRRPSSPRFDEVRECGCGALGVVHLPWCVKQKRIYSHPLLKG